MGELELLQFHREANIEIKAKLTDKPGSVVDSHSSATCVTAAPVATNPGPTRAVS